jgi:hypothetical protein
MGSIGANGASSSVNQGPRECLCKNLPQEETFAKLRRREVKFLRYVLHSTIAGLGQRSPRYFITVSGRLRKCGNVRNARKGPRVATPKV